MCQQERVGRTAARPPAKQLPEQCINQSAKAGAARSCSLPEHSIRAWNLTLGVLEFKNLLVHTLRSILLPAPPARHL